MSHPRRFIRDTSRYRPFRDLFNGRIPSLKALTQKVLGVNVQSGEHDSVEDARATMRLYTSVKRVWESKKKHRTSKTEQVKKNINLEEQGVLNVKDEYEVCYKWIFNYIIPLCMLSYSVSSSHIPNFHFLSLSLILRLFRFLYYF